VFSIPKGDGKLTSNPYQAQTEPNYIQDLTCGTFMDSKTSSTMILYMDVIKLDQLCHLETTSSDYRFQRHP